MSNKRLKSKQQRRGMSILNIMLGLVLKNTRFNFFVDDAKGTLRLKQPSNSLPQYSKRKPKPRQPSDRLKLKRRGMSEGSRRGSQATV